MPKHTKVCRVCGKEYTSCNSLRTGSPVFNWREVACSPECGQMYMELIAESRQKVSVVAHDDVEEAGFEEDYIIEEG